MIPSTTTGPVRLAAVLPLDSENRWSDMLAALGATDPQPLARALALDADPATLLVRREVATSGTDRPDILVQADGRTLAVVEAKVLAGLGHEQLSRYATSAPGAAAYVLLCPRHLPVGTTLDAPWTTLAWEDVLEAYTSSTHPWVAATASAWLDHITATLPVVDAGTVWGDLNPDQGFALALRVRQSWLYERVRAHAGDLDVDLVESSSGRSRVVRMIADTPVAGYDVVVEIEEALPARSYPRPGEAASPRGPQATVLLRRHGQVDSHGYDWAHLRALWEVMEATGLPWSTNPANPRAAHDRQAWAEQVAAGMPRHVGVGFGHAQARQTGDTMFGARVRYPATLTLGALADQTARLAALLRELAAVDPASVA